MSRILAHYMLLLSIHCALQTAAAQCNKTTCFSCLENSRAVDEGSCRWCKRDNKCYNALSKSTTCKVSRFTGACNVPDNILDKYHCDHELPRYDPELARKMLLLSSVAYDSVHPQECLDKALPSSGVRQLKVCTTECDSKGGECSGYVATAYRERAIVLAFRGSVDYSQVLEQIKDVIKVPKESFLFDKNPRSQVQRYWLTAFRKLWKCMEVELIARIMRFPNYRIWVTGHSLGGAIASLASSAMVDEMVAPSSADAVILYTFGMPRVGNYYYAVLHDTLVKNSWRVVNYRDAVPHFPTMSSILPCDNAPHHHGVEVFYQEPATTVYSKHKECHGRRFMEDETCSAQFWKFQRENHVKYFGIQVAEYCPKTARNSASVIIAHVFSVVPSVFLYLL